MKEVFVSLKNWSLEARHGDTLTLSKLRDIVGAKDRKSFNQALRSPVMIRAMSSIGVGLYRPHERVTGVIRV